jgi:hypothetical protein
MLTSNLSVRGILSAPLLLGFERYLLTASKPGHLRHGLFQLFQEPGFILQMILEDLAEPAKKPELPDSWRYLSQPLR